MINSLIENHRLFKKLDNLLKINGISPTPRFNVIISEFFDYFVNRKNIKKKLDIELLTPHNLNYIIDNVDISKNIHDIKNHIQQSKIDFYPSFFGDIYKCLFPQTDWDEYYTPEHIIEVMLNDLNILGRESIFDPFCGSGNILTKSYSWILKKTGISNLELYGNELLEGVLARLGMLILTNGEFNIKNIQKGDSFKIKNNTQYDAVITNIPFSGTNIVINSIKYCIDHTKNRGKMAIIVPSTFVNSSKYKNILEYLQKECPIYQIIKLSNSVFKPYTSVNSVILFCIKREESNQKTILFDIKNDGYSNDMARKKLDGKNDCDVFNKHCNRTIDVKLENGWYYD